MAAAQVGVHVDRQRATCFWLRLEPKVSRRASLSLRMDNLYAGTGLILFRRIFPRRVRESQRSTGRVDHFPEWMVTLAKWVVTFGRNT